MAQAFSTCVSIFAISVNIIVFHCFFLSRFLLPVRVDSQGSFSVMGQPAAFSAQIPLFILQCFSARSTHLARVKKCSSQPQPKRGVSPKVIAQRIEPNFMLHGIGADVGISRCRGREHDTKQGEATRTDESIVVRKKMVFRNSTKKLRR